MSKRMTRAASIAGGYLPDAPLTSATTINVPPTTLIVELTGTATCTSLLADDSARRRLQWFYQESGETTFTHTASPTTAGQMRLNGGNITLRSDEFLLMYLKSDGTWRVVDYYPL
jgi:hypothetical protein